MGEWAPGKGIWWSLPLHSKHIHLSFANVVVVGMRIILHMKWTPCLSDAWLHMLWISCLVASFFPPPLALYSHWGKLIGTWTLFIFIWVNWAPANNTAILRCKFLLVDRISSVLSFSAWPVLPQTEFPLTSRGALGRKESPATVEI